MVKPFLQSLYMSFCDVQVGAGSFEMIYNGLYNYNYAFKVDPDYSRLLIEGFDSFCDLLIGKFNVDRTRFDIVRNDVSVADGADGTA